jgi:hypothetical protein
MAKLKVTSILKKSEIEVFDISMPSNHNFILDNGVIAHNCSHAVAYSTISYACAFLKYHYPLEWWASILTNATAKEINEEFYPYVRDMVLPPDINVSTEKITIDYKLGKLRNKLSTISGVGEKVAEKIVAARPYTNIQDFVNKGVCGVSLAKKLIHVGVLDSLFGEVSLEQKIMDYDRAVKVKEFNDKVEKYKNDLLSTDQANLAKIAKIRKNLEKIVKEGAKEVEADINYMALTPKKDFLIKKSIFPTIQLDLLNVLLKNSNSVILPGPKFHMISAPNGEDFPLFPGEFLQRIDGMDMPDLVRFCVPGYIISAKEFTYSGGTRKALKMIVDSSGYISEKVMWPDYDTGILEYSKDLKEGAIVFLFYQKKPGKPYTNIVSYLVDEVAIK